jgi:hypothetical protein
LLHNKVLGLNRKRNILNFFGDDSMAHKPHAWRRSQSRNIELDLEQNTSLQGPQNQAF